MVSRSGLGGKSEDMIEAIVGNLAGRPGVDLVLVSPLAEIDHDSTDQLTLLSIGAAVAVLTWDSPEQTMSDLRRIGFDGVRSPHANDPSQGSTNATQVTGRKIYAFDLRNVATVDELIDQLDRLRKVQSVKTFSLGLPSSPSSQPRKSPLSTPPQPKVVDKLVGESRSVSQDNGGRQPTENRPQSSLGDAGLDDLIDQLDDFDH
ncbi:hypothetical protein [Rubripirellula obstinata]|uniref:hypothetical protein n=1 Tax=Rubripirellula obstinata TaxID=406547 RepID=UPI0012F95101|nr:hypothetical protein [Rubripirellula obstinata]